MDRSLDEIIAEDTVSRDDALLNSTGKQLTKLSHSSATRTVHPVVVATKAVDAVIEMALERYPNPNPRVILMPVAFKYCSSTDLLSPLQVRPPVPASNPLTP